MSSSRAIISNYIQVRGGSRLVRLVRLVVRLVRLVGSESRLHIGRGKEGVPEHDYKFHGTSQNFSRD